MDFAAGIDTGLFPCFLSEKNKIFIDTEIDLEELMKHEEGNHVLGAVHSNFFSLFFFFSPIKNQGVKTCACFAVPFFRFAVVLR